MNNQNLVKKLIFIVENFFTKRDFDRYDIQFFIDKNVKIEIWDITEFSNKNYHSLIKPADEIIGEYIKKFKNGQEIEIAFKNLNKEQNIIGAYINFNFGNLLIFKLMSKYKIKYFLRSGASITGDPKFGKKDFSKRLRSLIGKDYQSIIEYFLNYFLKILKPSFFGVASAPIYFKDSKGADKRISLKKKLIGKDTKIILSHHRDYDLYLKYKNNKDEENKLNAVFLDVNFGFHNDYIKIQEFSDPKKWYKSLESFFNFLKEKYSINTTICAHPRSNGEINNLIPNYKIIKNKTAQLVKNSSFVICQTSTAINFAVLFKKPMIFLYNHVAINNDKSKINHAGQSDFFAKAFNKKPIFIDNLNDFNLEKELKIDENCYKKFISEYIKSWGPEKKQSEMIFELL